jgi:hypothetical protein
VSKLKEPNSDICIGILNVFKGYVYKSRNLGYVIDLLIRFGLQNRNVIATQPKIQCEALSFLEPLIRLDLKYLQRYEEIGRLLEFTLSLVKSQSSTVSEKAKETLIAINALYIDFEKISCRLSPSYKSLFIEVTENSSIRQTSANSVASPESSVTTKKTASSLASSVIANHISGSSNNFEHFDLLPDSNGLIFGLIPMSIFYMLEDQNNWKSRAEAMEEIENLFFRITDLQRIEPHISVFCKYLLCLVDDKNFKISLSSLNLLNRILSLDGISRCLDLKPCINLVLSKLGDNKIAIRQAAASIYKRILYQASPNLLFPKLISGLASSNWHIREEVLNVIITAMLNPPKEPYDFLSLAPHIAMLLDDPKTKVRFVATEALVSAVKRCGLENVNKILEPILDESIYKKLQDRFSGNQLQLRNEYDELAGSVASIASSERSSAACSSSSPFFDESLMSDISPNKILRVPRSEIKSRPSELFIPRSSNVCTTSSRSTNDSSREMITRGRYDIGTGDETPYFGNRSDNNLHSMKPIKFFNQRTSQSELRADHPKSLKPPSFPINMTTKSGGGNTRLSFGYVQHRRKKQLAPLGKMASTIKRHSSLDLIQSPEAFINNPDLPSGKFLSPKKSEPDLLTLTISNISSPTSLCAPLLSPSCLTMQTMYIERADLEPVSNPRQELSKVLSDSITNEGWEVHSNCATTIRRLLKHHTEVFDSSTIIHSVVTEALKWVDSLRSSLARNGLMVIEEMAISLGEAIEPELDIICRTLIFRATDTNHFLGEASQNVMFTLCVHCTDGKMVNSLDSAVRSSKMNRSKAVAARCFKQIFDGNTERMTRLKELSKMLSLLNDFSTDASSEVREAAKQAMCSFKATFRSDNELNKVLSKYLDNTGIRRYTSIPNLDRTAEFKPLRSSSVVEKSVKPTIREKQEIKSAGAKVQHIRIRAQNSNLQIPEFDKIASIITEISHKDWKVRLEGLSRLEELVTRYSAELQSSTKILSILDCFSKLMNDSNLKVNIHALESFNLVIPKLVDTLETSLPLVIGAIIYNANSLNSVVRDLAVQVCETLKIHCSAISLLVPFCSTISSTNPKARQIVVKTLTEIVPNIPDSKSFLLKKHVVPVLFKLLEDPSCEIREESTRLVKVVYSSLGSWLIEKAQSGRVSKLLEIVGVD